MKKILTHYVLSPLILLFLVDHILVYTADRILLEDEAGFDDLMKTVELNFERHRGNGYGPEQCFFKYTFLIYGYQVCFVPANDIMSPIEERGFYVYYQSPRPKFSLIARGNSPDDYYFQIVRAGKPLKLIRSDGSIIDIKHGLN